MVVARAISRLLERRRFARYYTRPNALFEGIFLAAARRRNEKIAPRGALRKRTVAAPAGGAAGPKRPLTTKEFLLRKVSRALVILSEAKNLRGFRDPSLRSG